MATARVKASDRTKACQQVVTLLKKHYGNRVPTLNHDVLDTLLFAICLENNTFSQAQDSLQRLKESFFDYNEVRVSSITELQMVFSDQSHPEWRALRIRETLQYVFEGRYSYELEDMKKKNLEAAEKHLGKVESLTPFIVNHALLHTLGAHVVPVDDNMLSAAIWLGLLEDETKHDLATDQFKGAIRKADVPQFYFLFNQLANDVNFLPFFEQQSPKQENPLDAIETSPSLLKQLLTGQLTLAKPKATKNAAAKAKPEAEVAKKPAKPKAEKAAAKPASAAGKKTTKKAPTANAKDKPKSAKK